MNGARWKTNFLQALSMGNINTFQPHLQLANKSQGFRFQSATVLVNTSITKSLFIVLSKCLLLVQFRLALVFSPDFHKARAVVLCYVTDTTNFQTCVCWPLWLWAYQGQIILPSWAHIHSDQEGAAPCTIVAFKCRMAHSNVTTLGLQLISFA